MLKPFCVKFILVIVLAASLTGCGPSEKERKKNLATRIGKETCDDISNITTGIAGAFINSLLNQITDGNISHLEN